MSLIRQLRTTAAFSWAATILASACPALPRAYLPVIGPAPLRYRPVEDRANSFAQLPLPEPAKADSVPASPSSEQTEATIPFALSDLLAPAADRGSVVSEAANPAPVPESPPEQGPISPQIFLQYFNGGTNAPAVNPLAPVDFTPPRTAPTGRPPNSRSP